MDLIGVDPRFVRLEGQLLAHVSATQLPRQEGLALAGADCGRIGAGPLQPVLFQVGDRSVRTLVAVILQASDVGELVDSRVAIAPLGLAQSLSACRENINRILVEPRPGQDREVRRRLQRFAGSG